MVDQRWGPRHRAVAFETMLQLPVEQGATRCHVRVVPLNARPVVVITELADNQGLSIDLNFDVVATRVRRLLPAGCEPVWLERWEGRSLAAFVLHDTLIPVVRPPDFRSISRESFDSSERTGVSF